MRLYSLIGLFFCFHYFVAAQQKDSLAILELYNKGKEAYQADDYENAQIFWEQELNLKKGFYKENHPEIARTYHNIGSAFYYQNLLKRGKTYYERALDVLLDLLRKGIMDDSKMLSLLIKTYKQLTLIETKLGDYDKAILLYENCKNNLKIEAADIPDILVYKAQALEEKGGLFIDKAIEDYKEAIEIFKTQKAIEDVGTTLNDLGNAYNLKRLYLAAHEAYLASYDVLYNDVGVLSEDIFKVTNNLGASFIKIKDYGNAEKYLNDAIGLAENLYKDNLGYYRFSSPYHNLGDLYVVKGEDEKALQNYEKALGFLIRDFEKIKTDFPLQNIHNEIFKGPKTRALIALASRAKCLFKLNQKQAALDTYSFIDKVVFKLREDLSTESSNLHWIEETRVMYEDAAHLAVALNQPEKAFEFIEKSKSVLLFENLLRAEKIQLDNLSVGQKAHRDSLLEKIQLTENKVSVAEQDVSGKLAVHKNEKLMLKKELAAFDEKYFGTSNFEFDFRENALEDFKRYLAGENRTAIEFFGDVDNLLVAVIDGKSIRFHSYPKNENRAGNLKNWIANVSNPPSSSTEIKHSNELAAAIYQDLLAPLELPGGERLLIIPDGILQFVPFEALLCTADFEGKPLAELPYLLHRNPIGYAYSASVQLQLLQQRKVPSGKSLVIALKQFKDLPDLNSDEADVVSNLLRSDVLKEHEATASAFLHQVADYDLLHLSTHADASSTMQPWIAFRDRKLNLFELYNLNLNARLVTLSACETAKGELVKGEGVLSLARGFSFAGVPQVITSLWKVNEQSTTDIMTSFYGFIQQGLPVSEALAEAKKEYLATNSLSKAAPYHWAAFTALGHDSYVVDSGRNWWWIGALLILFLGLFLFFKQ